MEITLKTCLDNLNSSNFDYFQVRLKRIPIYRIVDRMEEMIHLLMLKSNLNLVCLSFNYYKI
jgi:hypothetical protein